jgi:hypothetical protein
MDPSPKTNAHDFVRTRISRDWQACKVFKANLREDYFDHILYEPEEDLDDDRDPLDYVDPDADLVYDLELFMFYEMEW